jgi:small neutral amino acid transporter SnatA (MarC family)
VECLVKHISPGVEENISLLSSYRSHLVRKTRAGTKGYTTEQEAEAIAIYTLAILLMVSPMGLETLTIISANTQVTSEPFIILTIMLLIVMGIKLVDLLSVEGATKYLSVDALEVANCILALLLAVLAMETIVNGIGELIQEVISQI